MPTWGMVGAMLKDKRVIGRFTGRPAGVVPCRIAPAVSTQEHAGQIPLAA